jgi:hypothetical protein
MKGAYYDKAIDKGILLVGTLNQLA